ncbi:MAG: hypothetical protein GY866_29605, partial [Proteobacteria bacterium]|nr:hypothetical protein [Pseudomonadota bacterium]
MSEKLAPTNDPALEEVRNQFEIWREAKKGNDRIPESLWQAAVDLTKTYSPHKIAKTLGLNCMRFKSRVNASETVLPINKEASGILDPALETVRLQFEKWRAGKGVNERIPVELWEAAVNLAETLSFGKITETLRLCYSRLKKRVEAAEALRLMEKGSVSAADSALEDVRTQFETWRESKKGHELIPEDLWLAAADLARTHSIGKVARTLGLKITGL